MKSFTCAKENSMASRIRITPTDGDDHNWGYRGASIINRRLAAYTDGERVKVEYNLEAISEGEMVRSVEVTANASLCPPALLTHIGP